VGKLLIWPIEWKDDLWTDLGDVEVESMVVTDNDPSDLGQSKGCTGVWSKAGFDT